MEQGAGAATQRWRLLIAYDGAAFRGFAVQPEVPTVAGALRQALERAARLREPPVLVCAGRTDAGVHARGQVVHVDLPAIPYDGPGLARALNRQLAPEVVVRRAEEVGPDFDARRSATGRSYRYLVWNAPVPDPLLASVAWHVSDPLDLGSMRTASDVLLGSHDFRSFCRRPPGSDASEPIVRRVTMARWSVDDGPEARDAAAGSGRRARRRPGCCASRSRRARSATRWSAPWWRAWSRWAGAARTRRACWSACGQPPGRAAPSRRRPRACAWSRWTTGRGLPPLLRRPILVGRPAGPPAGPEPGPGTHVRGNGSLTTRKRKIGLVRTFSPKVTEIQRTWYVVDADGLVLGRLASSVAAILRGKHRPYFAPHVDTGDHVIVVNADKVVLTSGKAEAKLAYRHSGYPGGLRSTSYAELLDEHPAELVRRSVRGMLPKNTLGRQMLSKLQVYAGPDHPHAAQKPEPLDLPAARRAG